MKRIGKVIEKRARSGVSRSDLAKMQFPKAIAYGKIDINSGECKPRNLELCNHESHIFYCVTPVMGMSLSLCMKKHGLDVLNSVTALQMCHDLLYQLEVVHDAGYVYNLFEPSEIKINSESLLSSNLKMQSVMKE